MLTVFTPTYNRAHLLPILYISLVKQTYTNFEWIIVDDGSQDQTELLVNEWIIENKIQIKYFKQQNGGKHRAINKGVSLAAGELFFIVDSDDFLPLDALKVTLEKYHYAKSNFDVVGVAGRRMYKDSTIVGSPDFTEVVSTSIDIRYKHKITGDLVEVFELEVLKKYPFPEFENEKFCPEALVWNRIAQKHQLLFFSKGIYSTEYIAGGLTDTIVKIRMQSPKASMVCYSELEKNKIPLVQKIKANSNFWRFSFCSNLSYFDKFKMVTLHLTLLGFPLGLIMHLLDKKKLQ